MEDIKTQKKSRFVKGSDEAKTFMKNLRDKKKGGKTPAPTPAPAPASIPLPISESDCKECIPVKPKRRVKKNIIVDF